MEDKQELGGNIELIGFSALDGGSMIVLKKIIGSYARKFSDNVEGFEKLIITHSAKEDAVSIKADIVVKGETKTIEVEEKNIFVAIDTCLKKAEESIS